MRDSGEKRRKKERRERRDRGENETEETHRGEREDEEQVSGCGTRFKKGRVLGKQGKCIQGKKNARTARSKMQRKREKAVRHISQKKSGGGGGNAENRFPRLVPAVPLASRIQDHRERNASRKTGPKALPS